MKIYFEANYGTLHYDETNHLIMQKWNYVPISEEYRELMNKTISAFEHFKTGKVIWDVRNCGLLPQEEVEWTAKNWVQRALEAGNTHQAFVMASNVLSHISASEIFHLIKNLKVIVNYFQSIEEAVEWMKEPG